MYTRNFIGLMARCVKPTQATTILEEIHRGACGMHSSARAVATKAICRGYYWPVEKNDVNTLLRTRGGKTGGSGGHGLKRANYNSDQISTRQKGKI